MKTLLITLLLSISIFGQSGKSVLTQAQKDSIQAMINDYWDGGKGVVNVKNFGVVADGVTDDSDSLESIIATYSTNRIIYMPKGVYNLATFIDTVDTPLAIIGDGENQTILKGDTASSNNYFAFRNSFLFDKVKFDNWNIPIRINTAVDSIDVNISNSSFTNIRQRCIDIRDLSSPYAYIKSFVFLNNIVDSCESGIRVVCDISSAIVSNNTITNLLDGTDDTGVSDGAQAIILGQESATDRYSDTYLGSFIVSNNVIENVKTTLATSVTSSTRGILVYGFDVIVTGNTINDLVGNYPATNNEPIYIKAVMSNISNNLIRNSGTMGQAIITSKSPVSYANNNIIANNVIYMDSSHSNLSGSLFNGILADNVSKITGNIITLYSGNIENAIYIDADITAGQIWIENNNINIEYGNGIFIATNDSGTAYIDNNTIRAKTGFIKFASGGSNYSTAYIRGNTFESDSGALIQIRSISENVYFQNNVLNLKHTGLNLSIQNINDIDISGNIWNIRSGSNSSPLVSITTPRMFTLNNNKVRLHGIIGGLLSLSTGAKSIKIINNDIEGFDDGDTTKMGDLFRIQDGTILGDVIIEGNKIEASSRMNIDYTAKIRMDSLAGDLSIQNNFLNDYVDRGFYVNEAGGSITGNVIIKNNVSKIASFPARFYNLGATTRIETSDIITNGDFTAWTGDNPDGWEIVNEASGNSINESSGKAHIVGVDVSQIRMTQVITVGEEYYYSIDITDSISGFLTVGDGVIQYDTIGTVGTHTGSFTATFNKFTIRGTTICDLTIDNVYATRTVLPVISGNVGYETSNAGIATIGAGDDSVVVTHSLKITPLQKNIITMPSSTITNIGSSTFQIGVPNVAVSDSSFTWFIKD